MAIFKKRDQWWIGYKVQGKRRREPVGRGASYAQAKDLLRKRLGEVVDQRHFPANVAAARSFAEIADKWWGLHGQGLKQTGLLGMFDEIKRELGSKRLNAMTAEDIQRYVNAIETRTSKATANRHLTVIKGIFSKAREWKLFYGDAPSASVKARREPAHRLRYLSQEEMKALLDHAHPRLYPLLMCALLTGMRRGEVLGLTWENVSLDRAVIYLLKTKSGRPREVPIPDKLRAVLLSLSPSASGPVFDLPVIMLRRFFAQALKDAKVPAFRWHDLRHTFASWFMMKGGNLYTLQTLLGHSSPNQTQRYAHLGRGHLLSEIAAFESAIPIGSISATIPICPRLSHQLETRRPASATT